MQWRGHADGEVGQGEEAAWPERQKGGVEDRILEGMRSHIWRGMGNGTRKSKRERFRQRKPQGQDLEVRSSVALDKNLLFEIRRVPSWEDFSVLLEPMWNCGKRYNQPKTESLVLSPTSANQDLTAASAYLRTVTFMWSIWNHLVSTSEVICTTDPTPSPKGK